MIQINDEWRMKSDPMNIILERLHKGLNKNKEKVENWRVEGYYPNYKYALNGMVNKSIMEIDDIKLICDKLDQIEKQIQNINFKEEK